MEGRRAIFKLESKRGFRAAARYCHAMTLRATAPCKINFFLEITGKRPDGYHTLSTIFQTISLKDNLTCRLHRDLTLTCSDPTLPTDQRNLVMRAATVLRETLDEPKGAAIHLEK